MGAIFRKEDRIEGSMSFGGKSSGSGENSVIAKRFVSETELEEIKKKRDEEWEEARKQGREIEREEDIVYDGRTLYDRLKEQKDQKQEEFEEQLKFKNMIYKGLDKEDATFLSNVSQKQAEFHGRRFGEDDSELQSYRAAVDSMLAARPEKTQSASLSKKPSPKINMPNMMKPKATAVIIRKRPSATEKADHLNSKQAKGDDDTKEEKTDKNKTIEQNMLSQPTSLQGLIAYSDSDSSDSE